MKITGSTLAKNRRAHFDYELSDLFEAGIALEGFEVKAARAGKMNLSGSYVLIKNKQPVLFNATIEPYQPANTPEGYDSGRTRKLLLKKEEITLFFPTRVICKKCSYKYGTGNHCS